MSIKTAVIGAAGRMGRELIVAVLDDPALELAGAVECDNCPSLGRDAGSLAGCGEAGVPIVSDPRQALAGAEAVIDFSSVEAVVKNARAAVAADCSVVIGITGLTEDDRSELSSLAKGGGRIVLAPNMSVGVNLLFHLCRQVGEILGLDYDAEVVEMHHNKKKDAPSGTAVKLGEILVESRGGDARSEVVHGRSGMVGARPVGEVGIHALRGGDVVGEHNIIFATQGERVELAHKASSRQTFCRGAVRAVKFLAQQKSGLFDMQDVLGLR